MSAEHGVAALNVDLQTMQALDAYLADPKNYTLRTASCG